MWILWRFHSGYFSLLPPLKAPLSQLEKLEPKQAIQIVWMSHFKRDNTPGRKKNFRKEKKFWTLTFFLLQMAILRIIFRLKSSKKIKKFKFWRNFKKSHQSVNWSLRDSGRPYLATNNKWITYFKILRKVKKTCFFDFFDRISKAISWLKTRMRA